MIFRKPTVLPPPEKRAQSIVHWDGEADTQHVPFGSWVIRKFQASAGSQISAPDLVREFEAALRDSEHLRRKARRLGLTDGWDALAVWLDNRQLGLSIDWPGAPTIDVCPTCKAPRR